MRRGANRSSGWLVCVVVVVFVATWPASARANGFIDLWLTPDQQAQRELDAGEYAAAAGRFRDPMRAGLAWYRAGEFERAAQAFGRSAAPEAHFNRGNALVLQGAYDEAIAAYEQALAGRPEWTEAIENRTLAELRKARLAKRDDAGGTGGQLAADDYVFDDAPAKSSGSSEETETTEGGDGPMTDDRLRELWLRRVQTRPADFLAARFERQLQLRAEEAEGAGEGTAEEAR